MPVLTIHIMKVKLKVLKVLVVLRVLLVLLET